MSQSEDPLLQFHPELSMDGLSQHGKTSSDRSNSIDDTECEIVWMKLKLMDTKAKM